MIFQVFIGCLFDIIMKLILWIVFIPLLVIFVFLLAFRTCLNLLAKFFRPDLFPIKNLIDHLFCVAPSKINQHVHFHTIIWMLKERLDVGHLRNHFQNVFLSAKEKIERYVNFYCYFVQWAFYIWKKTVNALDLSERIRERTVSFQLYRNGGIFRRILGLA